MPNYSLPLDENYLIKATDPLADLLDQDRKDLIERIDKLESLGGERNTLMYDNLSRLDQEDCYSSSLLSSARSGQPYDTRRLQGLEKNVLDVEQRKRMEKGGAWKDIWLITKEL